MRAVGDDGRDGRRGLLNPQQIRHTLRRYFGRCQFGFRHRVFRSGRSNFKYRRNVGFAGFADLGVIHAQFIRYCCDWL